MRLSEPHRKMGRTTGQDGHCLDGIREILEDHYIPSLTLSLTVSLCLSLSLVGFVEKGGHCLILVVDIYYKR